MRVILAGVTAVMALAILGTVDGAMTSANAQSCHDLWVERNAYYKRRGYCFRTARAIRYFGNAGCFITNQAAVPLTPGERVRIGQIRRMERALGCTG